MELKNKYIAEGMRVTNGKDKLKVISWDKSYSDCLLNYLDSKGNRYVVAENYELSGTEKDPQISWMNGRYFTANSDDEAFETYLDYLGGVHEYDISESKKVKSTSIKESLDIADLILDKLNELVRNELRGLTITDRTDIFSASAYMDAKKEIEKILKKNELESKKVKSTSIKESAKPINEKNVAKFVDELNEWCDDNIHYKDEESARYTKEYGKLYDFGYNWDYSYGDKGDLLVFDKEETLDWYDDEVVVPFIKQLAKKYGWYCEPAHSYSDFMFAEL